MNSIIAGRVRQIFGLQGDGSQESIRHGANLHDDPTTVIAAHQWRTLFPWVNKWSRKKIAGQGTTQELLSTGTFGACPFPDGSQTKTITPIYTPVMFDDYGLPIDGGPKANDDTRSVDTSPGNSIIVGVIGNLKRLPFLSGLTAGPGIKATDYGKYAYKDPNTGVTYQPPGPKDRRVNKPLLEVNTDGTSTAINAANQVTALIVPETPFISGPGIIFDPPLQQPGRDSAAPAVTVFPQMVGLDPGSYLYASAHRTSDNKLGPLSPASVAVVTDGNRLVQAALPDLGTLHNKGPASLASRELYRTPKGGGVPQLLVAGLGLGVVVVSDTTPDSGLGAAYSPTPIKISVDLATDAAGVDVSNLVSNAGSDLKGLKAAGGGGSAYARIYNTDGEPFHALADHTVLFAATYVDTSGFYDPTHPTRLTVPVGMAGDYRITVCLKMSTFDQGPSPSPSADYSYTVAWKVLANGVDYLMSGASLVYGVFNGVQQTIFQQSIVTLAEADYFDARVFITSTNSAANTISSNYFSMINGDDVTYLMIERIA